MYSRSRNPIRDNIHTVHFGFKGLLGRRAGFGFSGRSVAVLISILTCLPAPHLGNAKTSRALDAVRNSVVKIYVTVQRNNHALPWQTRRPTRGVGSGFVITGRRILTNAHIISDATYIEVQKEGDPVRYRARVTYAAHDCDLAIIQIDDQNFYKGTVPARFARNLPTLNDRVTVVGYPMGGTRVSITQGVVSRIDYSMYSHSGVDEHLVLQVDAAINPGNSGGPVTYHGKVVGLAFQGIRWADNIGYAIPLPVLNRFLRDIQDGRYHGYPELGIANFDTENPAMRRDLGLADDAEGTAVTYVDPFSSAYGYVLPRDVILEIDGHTVSKDATIQLDGNTMLYAELLERKQVGDSVTITLWRDHQKVTVKMPLIESKDPFVYRYPYDEQPKFVTLGGLVFTPLSRGYLHTLGRRVREKSRQQLFYLSQYAKVDGLYKDRSEFVVLARRLPHPVNTYAENYSHGVLVELNGRPISSIEDIVEARDKPINEFHVLRFKGSEIPLVLEVEAVRESEADILQNYFVPSRQYLGASR